MEARLQLVRNEVSRHESRVFTASVLERLAQLNHAERALRGMGLRVLQVSWGESRPVIRIERSATTSIAPLLDRMGMRSFKPNEGATDVWGEFEGVTVCWRESSPATSAQHA